MFSKQREYREPLWLDKLHMSPNWFTGKPWTESINPWTNFESNRPYKHSDFRALLLDLGHSEHSLNLAIQDHSNAQRWTERLSSEVHSAWEEVRRLRTSTNVKVNVITQQLQEFDADRLRSVINDSWHEVTRPAQGQIPTTLSGPEISEVDFRVIINMLIGVGEGVALPVSRHAEVEEYFQLFDVTKSRTSKFGGEPFYQNADIVGQITKENYLQKRKTFLLPFLNQQDLSNPELLRCLILNRVLKHPRTFARAETQLPLAAGCSRRVRTYEDYAVVFQEPTPADAKSPLFVRLRQSGLLFGWGEGATVLVIQAITLRLVRVIMEKLMEEWTRLKMERMDLSDRLPDLGAHTWENIPADRLVFNVLRTGLVNRAQFCPPSTALSPWDEEFAAILQAQSDKAKAHLKRLWHDPFFFQQQVMTQFHQHYGHIEEGVWVSEYNVYHPLTRETIDPNLAGAVRHAWIDLVFHARCFAELHMEHIVRHGGYFAAERIRGQGAREWRWKKDRPEDVIKYANDWKWKRENCEDMSWGEDGDWNLPAGLFKWTLNYHYGDVFESKFEKKDLPTKEQWWSMRTFRFAIADCLDSRGCLGMSKLVQPIHTDIHQRHQSLGIQLTVSEDYGGIVVAGLLSDRMETIHPIADDIDDPEDWRRHLEKSPEDTLRLMHWVLGVTYHPFSAQTLSRSSGLVQQWLIKFWTEISKWIDEHDYDKASGDRSFGKNKKNKKQEKRQTGNMTSTASKTGSRWRHLNSKIFRVSGICGDITNIAPQGHREPPTRYQPTVGSRHLMQSSAEDTRHETLRLAQDQDRKRGKDDSAGFIDSMMLRNRPDNIIRKADWDTMEILYGAKAGTFTEGELFSLCRSLGLDVKDGRREGSRSEIVMTERSLFWTTTGRRKISVHAAHHSVDKVTDGRRRSFRRALEEEFGTTLDLIQELYRCQGT
ncbi:hypothetical protein CPLU01_09884 [Colletotrichum plurivorum]|uniref:Uncharacterized protein n=1 Tax=Colletotrichum plurivorum TaxID=2175906 RepID=A0A8H6NB36_9PEZI|nr:hypothetical protein CPLU01_09884 [Colletotrichum plurivorum]